MGLESVVSIGMTVVVLALPLSLSAVLGILLRVAGGGGIPRPASYPPGVIARAERTSARIRAHYLRRREPAEHWAAATALPSVRPQPVSEPEPDRSHAPGRRPQSLHPARGDHARVA